jgi:hypothetical protein
MSDTIYDKQQLLNRMRVIKGQIEGIEKALTEERDCYSILKDVSEVCNFIYSSFNDLICPYDEGKLKVLFKELINWDRNIYDIIEKTADWLENISKEVFNLMEVGKLEEANRLISDSRKALRLIKSELKETTRSCFHSTRDIQSGNITCKDQR